VQCHRGHSHHATPICPITPCPEHFSSPRAIPQYTWWMDRPPFYLPTRVGPAPVPLGFVAPTLVLAASEAELYQRWRRAWLKWQRQQLGTLPADGGGSTAGGSGGGASGRRPAAASVAQRLEPPEQLHTEVFPCLRPPTKAAACLYDLLCHHPFTEPADAAVAALTALLLTGAAWQAILAVTPV